MFPNLPCERPALSPPSITFYFYEKIKIRQLRISPSQELEAYTGKPTAVAASTSETLGYKETHNLCCIAFLNITAERQVHFPVPADPAQGTTTVLWLQHLLSLSWSHRHLREVAHDSSAEQLGGYESQVLALFPLVPVHPECLIKIQRIKKKSKKAFWGRKFLVSVSKTYSSSVLLKCVYSIAR